MQTQKPKQGYKIVKSLFGKYEEIPEEWKYEKLSDNSTIKGRIGWQGLTTDEYRQKGKFYLVTGTDFRGGRIDWGNCVFVDAERFVQDKNIQLKKGDVLVTKDGTIGKIAYVDTIPLPTTLNSGIFVIRPIGKAYFPLFLYYVLYSDYFNKFLNRLQAGSTINHLYQKDFVNFHLPIPSIKEQQKIASILSNVDSLIHQTREIIEQTQRLKKGLLQKLLTKGIGHTKFKSANLGLGFLKIKIPVSWNVKKINEIGDVVRGASPRPAGDPKYFGGIIPWITVGEITKDANIYLDSVTNGLTEEGREHSRFLEKGTFIIANSGATLGVPKILKISGCANDGVAAILDLRELIPEYLYYIIYSWIDLLRNINQGMGQPNLNTTIIGNITVPCPPVIEQQKILDILWKIDSQIQKQQECESKLENLKKGLMQKLLTGQIRVKV